MDTARIVALLTPFLGELQLSEKQLDQISIYIDLLKRWNARINLTAIRNEEEIVTRHFGESFFMASHLFPVHVARTLLSAKAEGAQRVEETQLSIQRHPERSPAESEATGEAKSKACSELAEGDPYLMPRILDIGSGAGFPAIPLILWAPHIHLTMIDSNHKKATFLREVARTLTLTNVNVITDRSETLAGSEALQSEVVTLRAVERFETILPEAVSFLAPNGRIAHLIGAKQVPHLTTVASVKWHPPIPVPQSETRVLSIGVRV